MSVYEEYPRFGRTDGIFVTLPKIPQGASKVKFEVTVTQPVADSDGKNNGCSEQDR